MHKIKSAARHSAYKDKYNPFNRVNSRSSRTLTNNDAPDIEQDAAIADSRLSTHSANCAEEIETDHDRREPKQGVKHASTMPTDSSEPTSATSTHPPIDAFEKPKGTSGSGGPSEKTLTNGDLTDGEAGATSGHRSRPSLIGAASFRAFGKRRKGAHEEQKQKEEEDKSKSKFRQRIPVMQQVKAVLFPQWLTINWLLIAVPVGIAIAQVKSIPPIAVFVVNFIAIIPLAGILSYATEEIAMRVGETLGGLLNASFGNAVELIVGIIALVKREIIITQTSLIGSMLSNLLLVLGMCFFFGGINRIEQNFNVVVAQTAASLLALSAGCLLIPTAFTWGVGSAGNGDEKISRGTAIIMLLIYASYLIFQLKSHKEIYNAPSQKVEKRKGAKKDEGETIMALAHAGAGQAAHIGGAAVQRDLVVQHEEEEEDPQLSMFGSLFTLCASTALVGVCAEFLVDSIKDVTCEYPISQYFVGLILLPIVGNAAEHATAVTVAIKDKMDLAIGVAVGSSMQIALLVLPLMVVLGWIMGRDMTLVFDDFQIAVLFVAVLLVNYLISDGKSHWMEGVLLMSLYIIIALASWFYPNPDGSECGGSTVNATQSAVSVNLGLGNLA